MATTDNAVDQAQTAADPIDLAWNTARSTFDREFAPTPDDKHTSADYETYLNLHTAA